MLETGTAPPDAHRPGHYGAAGHGVRLQALDIVTAWNLQGPGASAPLIAAVFERFGLTLPREPNRFRRGEDALALWLGPASWLLLTKKQYAPADFDAARDAFNAQRGALFDLSQSRVAWRIAGEQATAVLNSGCPLDLDSPAFGRNACAQSLFGHVPALLYRETPAALVLLVARSYARDAWQLLCSSAAQYGYDVAAPAAIDDASIV